MADEISPELMRAGSDLRVALGRVVRRLRQGHVEGELTQSESSVLARLDRDGPATPGCLADLERIRPQAMGVTLGGLVERDLVTKRPDARDGRKVLMTITPAGRRLMTDRRSRTTERVAAALGGFTTAERKRLMDVVPLLERLAEEL